MFNQYALGIVSNEYKDEKRNNFFVVITMSESENIDQTIDWKEYITEMEQLQHFCRKEIKWRFTIS